MAETEQELGSVQAVMNKWNMMRSDMNEHHLKITELEQQLQEHTLVVNALKPLDPSRKCYRMIGGVLVERTVREVLPAVQRNRDGIEETVKRMVDALEKKAREIAAFEAKYKIKLRGRDEVAQEQEQEERKKKQEQGGSSGILVSSS